MSRLATLVLVLLVASACNKKSDPAPFAPGGSGPVYANGGGSRGDAATARSDEDGGAGPRDAGKTTVNECENVTAVNGAIDPLANPTVNAISSPSDFQVTRVKTTWEPDCSVPTIRIEMSDGLCPPGLGHALVFDFSVNAIKDDGIHTGQNIIQPLTTASVVDGIAVRYVRPSSLSPSGTWGTCEGANGTLDIVGEIDPTIFGPIQARFDLLLTDCTGMNKVDQQVTGSFNGQLRRTLKTACPDAM